MAFPFKVLNIPTRERKNKGDIDKIKCIKQEMS
jgi:hypothetical protein